jgi:tRNA pseudouridine65 synthase
VADTTPPEMAGIPTAIQVLAVCDGLVVVDKPSGLLVHNSAFAGPREVTVTSLLRAAAPAPGLDPAAWQTLVPIHRLDRGTSGALAFAPRTCAADAQERLGAARKLYVALVRGRLAGPVEVDHPINDDDVPGSLRRPARSRLAPIAQAPIERASLIAVEPFTGRRHQVRRHCKHACHPILGDATHGKGPLNRAYRAQHGLARLSLHAAALALPGRLVQAPLPADLQEPWSAILTLDAAALVDAAVLRWGTELSDGV